MNGGRIEYMKEYRRKRRLAGICLKCKSPATEGVHCKKHAAASRSKTHQRMVTECRYKRLFNITFAEYKKLLKSQNGRCAICNRKPSKKRRLAVDHNHETQWIRGLLCWRCNDVLGRVKDDTQLLSCFISYIELPPAFSVIGCREVGKVRYGRC